MKCAMCNGFIQDKFRKLWTVNVPDGKLSICGRCYVLTAILDKLNELTKKENSNG